MRNARLSIRLRSGALIAATFACALCCTAVALALPPFTDTPKSSLAGGGAQAELYRLRASCHATFDRVVIWARFGIPGYNVLYVSRVRHSGSGVRISLPGAARLLVEIRPARGHTAGGAALLPKVVTPLCPNLRQLKSAGDFEGVVSYGLGLRKKTGYGVIRLNAPTRIVIDIAH